MRLEGTTNIKAPRDKAWAFLTDAYKVCECAPGVESIDIVEPDKKFKVIASVGFGSVKARFVTDVEWLEADPPNRAVMKAHGKATGSAMDALAEMTLSDGPNGSTDLAWVANVTVVGTIASLASRLMGSVTQKLTGEFFNCAKQKIEA
jgi:carbon monoxide dehydrogenase subunit G